MGRIPVPHTGNVEQDRAWRAVDEAISELYSQHGRASLRGGNSIQDQTGKVTTNTWDESHARDVGTSVGQRGVAISDASGVFALSGPAGSLVPNLSVGIATIGRPVLIMVIPDLNTGTPSFLGVTETLGGAVVEQANFSFYRDGAVLTTTWLYLETGTAPDPVPHIQLPPSLMAYIDIPPAGTHTYQFQVSAPAGSRVQATGIRLAAVEL